jgi:hypothetical protein
MEAANVFGGNSLSVEAVKAAYAMRCRLSNWFSFGELTLPINGTIALKLFRTTHAGKRLTRIQDFTSISLRSKKDA